MATDEMSSAQQQSLAIGPELDAKLAELKAEQDAKERLDEKQKDPKEQAATNSKKEILSPCSEAVESGEVTPGHEGVKRKDRKTWHQPPSGYFDSKK